MGPEPGSEAEPQLVRYSLTVPLATREEGVAHMLAAFPAGIEEDVADDRAVLSGYLDAGAPAPAGLDLAAELVVPGWREGWRAFHRPVRIGRFWVGPPWLEPQAGCEPIVIEPGLAFGTGTHGSTRAAAELLLRQRGGGPLADLGCGSGVLAILAARLGFAPIRALDVDPHAVVATRANAARNGAEVAVDAGDVLRDPLPRVPLAVANLERSLLVPLFARGDLPPRIIVSGLLAAEPFAPAGFAAVDTIERGGWRAITLERR